MDWWGVVGQGKAKFGLARSMVLNNFQRRWLCNGVVLEGQHLQR